MYNGIIEWYIRIWMVHVGRNYVYQIQMHVLRVHNRDVYYLLKYV